MQGPPEKGQQNPSSGCDCCQLLAYAIIFVMVFSLAFVVLSASVIHPIFLVQSNFVVDDVNGTVTLGSLGYCLTMSNDTNTTCTGISLLYEISQFLSNHRIS